MVKLKEQSSAIKLAPADLKDGETYLAWKRRKVEAALQQSEDRSQMKSAAAVWDAFGFER